MQAANGIGKRAGPAGLEILLLAGGLAWVVGLANPAEAYWPLRGNRHSQRDTCPPCADGVESGEWAGAWYWLRSPEQERRVVASLYDRYCARCHGDDGRGVWDMPDVPDFTNARWQAHRSDAALARAIVQGRGAVMPAFRGTLTLEEAWAMARYLRTFLPGTQASRPDLRTPEKPVEQLPAPKAVDPAPSR
jgi:mono/diheme cytochrome c family protein